MLHYPTRTALFLFFIVASLGLFSSLTMTPKNGPSPAHAASTTRIVDPSSVVELAAGGRSTCALFANGGVKCWGFNGLGTLGYGDTTNRGTTAAQMGTNLPYVDLGTGRTAVAIAAKGWHVCVILDNGSVKCWGNNDGGQLGYGDTTQRGDDPGEMGDNLPTVNVGTGRTAKKIAVNFSSTCAILDNDTLKCWGFNQTGQLGLGDTAAHGSTTGTMGDALPTINLGTGRFATDIAMGAGTTCALLDNATVKCWGETIYGHGSTQTQVGRLASHMGDALVAFDLGTVSAGTDGNGTGDALLPRAISGEVVVQRISVGLNSICALFRADQSAAMSAKCWGNNSQGELGYGLTYGMSDIRGDAANEMGNALPIIAFGGADPVALVSHGWDDTNTYRCALLSDGSVKCWGGFNTYGQLGSGSTVALTGAPSSINPVNVGSGRTVQQIVVGESHACVLLDNNDVKCWGQNSAGQLGLGHSANRGGSPAEMGDALLPVDLGTTQSATVTPSPATTATTVITATASAVSTSTRTPTITSTATATPTSATQGGGLTPAAAITAGDNATCLLASTGNLRCYGYNFYGQLGYGNTNNYGMFDTGPAPTLPLVDVSSTHAVVDIQLSGTHACALLSDGTVKCWGNANRGVLGYGNETNIGDSSGEMGAALPTINLGTGRTARSIAVGETNSCALRDNDSLVCWGNGIGSSDGIRHGSIPDSMGDALPALSLSSTHTIESLSVGDTVVCAVLSDATLKCFGMNSTGVLGVPFPTYYLGYSGDMGDALPIVDLGSSSAVRAVAVGKWHACAIVNAGRVKCWGLNEDGQLGNGTTANIGDDAGEMGDNLPFVDLGSGRSARSISAGARHTCAVLDNNALKCWGANTTGQLGQGTTANSGDDPGEMGDTLAPINLGTTVTIQSVAVGDEHTCVLFVDHSVRCFGRGREGQLGYGNFFDVGSSPSEMGSALASYAVEPLYPATATPTPSATATLTPSATAVATATAVPSATLTASTTRTASKTHTPSRTKSPTTTLTPRKTLTPSRTATRTRSQTPTKSPTTTASVTRTKSATLPPTVTRPKSLTPTKSPTRTKTLTRTRTPTRRP